MNQTARKVRVIDMFGLAEADVRSRYPEVYQHLLATVKLAREKQYAKSPTRDSKEYLDRWWTLSKQREELRPAIALLPRYIGTARTAKHRVFSFVPGDMLPESEVVAIASQDALQLGVLSSRIHDSWVKQNKGTLENRPRYLKSSCFDPFPFPECSDELKARIRSVAEELDALRKARQAEHPRLTLTQMYNVLEMLKAGEPLDAGDERIKTEGLVLILKELHEKLDALVFDAYGWPGSLADEDILSRLVDLNKRRALEEKIGIVKWLRPDYQISRFGSEDEKASFAASQARAPVAPAETSGGLRPRQAVLDLGDDLREMMPPPSVDATKPKFQTGNELAETADVMRVLATATQPLDVEQIARTFAQGKAVEKRIALTILALARLGHLSSTDGGETFTLRRVAVGS